MTVANISKLHHRCDDCCKGDEAKPSNNRGPAGATDRGSRTVNYVASAGARAGTGTCTGTGTATVSCCCTSVGA
jgi:hypothetical protein